VRLQTGNDVIDVLNGKHDPTDLGCSPVRSSAQR
jgi:hypothetical protein